MKIHITILKDDVKSYYKDDTFCAKDGPEAQKDGLGLI